MIATDRGIGMTSQRTRDRLVMRLREKGIRNEKVLDVIGKLPRHLFVDEALASRAYEDTALPIGYNQTISQPYVVAMMTDLVTRSNPHKVLEIGTGSGYQAAVLAPLVEKVYTVERIAALSELARKRFRDLRIRNVRVKHSDGGMGLPEYGPFDGILVTAAPEGIPRALVAQLRTGGVMILPIGTREEQVLVRVTRTEEHYDTEILERVAFVPLLGGVE